MVGIKKLGCLGVLSRKTSKNPQKDESYQEGFRTDPYLIYAYKTLKFYGVYFFFSYVSWGLVVN